MEGFFDTYFNYLIERLKPNIRIVRPAPHIGIRRGKSHPPVQTPRR
jgi:hypothetical protein